MIFGISIFSDPICFFKLRILALHIEVIPYAWFILLGTEVFKSFVSLHHFALMLYMCTFFHSLLFHFSPCILYLSKMSIMFYNLLKVSEARGLERDIVESGLTFAGFAVTQSHFMYYNSSGIFIIYLFISIFE